MFHEQTGVYFDEVTGNGATRYVPRSVQVDLEAGVCNKVCEDMSSESIFRLIIYCLKLRSGVLGSLFRPDTYLTSNSGAGNNWAKGCEYLVFVIGATWIDIVRRLYWRYQHLGTWACSSFSKLVFQALSSSTPSLYVYLLFMRHLSDLTPPYFFFP